MPSELPHPRCNQPTVARARQRQLICTGEQNVRKNDVNLIVGHKSEGMLAAGRLKHVPAISCAIHPRCSRAQAVRLPRPARAVGAWTMLVPKPDVASAAPSRGLPTPLSAIDKVQPNSLVSYATTMRPSVLVSEERVLQGVDHAFDDDEADADRFAGDDRTAADLGLKRLRAALADHGLRQCSTQFR